MEPIPFGDLKRQYLSLKKEIDNTISCVLEKGWFILGQEVEKFEQEFADYCGKRYGIGVGNGTDAVFLTLLALNIKEGDEVITVANTAIPCISAIVASKARPVFVDVGEDYLIDVNKIEEKITNRTRAIMPVHLYGQVCDMHKILEIAEKHNIPTVEDCCQAHGAEYKGKKCPIGDIGAFSFYPSKNLGCFGDGGMILTNNKELAEKLKMIRNYGQSDKYNAKIHGHNSRLDEMQAAILRIKLSYLDKWNEKRRNIASYYNSKLKNDKIFDIPLEKEDRKHIYHLYVVRTDKRNELRDYLKENNIGTDIHYPIPLHLQEAYKYLGYKEGELPNTEKYSKEILSLPIFPELTDEEIERVFETIIKFLK